MTKKVLLTLAVFTAGVMAFAGYRYTRLPDRKVSPEAAAMIRGTLPMTWSTNEKSIENLRDRLRRDPDNPGNQAALGHALIQKARETGDPNLYGQAEDCFDRALRRDRAHVDAIVGKASLALSRHQFAEAREFAEQAIALNPDTAAPYGMLTDALAELGDYPGAIRAAEKMTSLKPNLSSYSRISYLRELHGDVAGAEQAMRMAIEAGAPNAENTAWCIVQLGNLYLNSERTSEAELAFNAALQRFPNYAHALAGLARVDIARKELEHAAEMYRKAIAIVPLPEFLIGLGEVYEKLNRTSDANTQFELVGAIQQIYRSNGVEMDGDMALFEADHGADPGVAVRMAAAEWERRKSVKTADVYAWALYRAGRVREASAMIKEATRLGTKDPQILNHARLIADAR